ncbi:MAG: hypothetical protein KGJ63_02880 [Pseudomonadota bacterium]|nr:hypothetical protein [Pseudomonadota bacterium]
MAKDEYGRLAASVSAQEIDRLAFELRSRRCLSCDSKEPVDVFPSYFVYSVVLWTSWRKKRNLSCRSCGRKRQAKELAASLLLGWWGFPFGLVVTPIIVLANVIGMVRNPLGKEPGNELKEYARLVAAHEIWKQQHGVAYAPMPSNSSVQHTTRES